MSIEFLRYEEINQDKFLGVATVRDPDFGKLVYRIIQRKDESGFFVSPPQFLKDDKWRNWYSPDSESKAEEIKKLIYSEVKKYYEENDQQKTLEEIPF